MLGVSPFIGVAAAPAWPVDLPVQLGCKFSFLGAAAYTAADCRGSVVWAPPPDVSLLPSLSFFQASTSIVTPPPPISLVDITPSRRRRDKARVSAERPTVGGMLWQARPSRDGTTDEPPPRLPAGWRYPTALAAKPGRDGEGAPPPAYLPAGGTRQRPLQASRVPGWRRDGGVEDVRAGVDVVAKRIGGPMGGRESINTEAMLSTETAALEEAERDGISAPDPDARARAVPVRARRSARRATASPHDDVAAVAAETAP